MASVIVQARIDPEVKKEAAAVLSAIGLTVSDAVRLMLIRVAHEKALPFHPLIPNGETLAAMAEAETGNLETVNSVEELFEALNEED